MVSHPPARIVIYENCPVVREGLAHWLAKRRDVVVAGEVTARGRLEPLLARARPNVLLMDPLYGEHDGVTFVQEVTKRHPRLRILVFSHQEENIYAERILRAGASGYLMKHATREEFTAALRTVLADGTYVSARMSLILLGRLLHPTSRSAEDAQIASLTAREFHVFQLLGAGLRPREIGTRLGVSVKTVQAHRENIKNKLGCSNSPELLRHAVLWVSQHATAK